MRVNVNDMYSRSNMKVLSSASSVECSGIHLITVGVQHKPQTLNQQRRPFHKQLTKMPQRNCWSEILCNLWSLSAENKTGLGPWNIVPARKVAHRKQTAPSTTFLDPKNQPQSSSYVDLDKDLGENIKIIKSKKGRNKKVMQSKESISQTKSKKQNMQEKITNPNIHLANCKDLPGEKHVTTPRVGKKSFTQIENLLGRTHWYDPP